MFYSVLDGSHTIPEVEGVNVSAVLDEQACHFETVRVVLADAVVQQGPAIVVCNVDEDISLQQPFYLGHVQLFDGLKQQRLVAPSLSALPAVLDEASDSATCSFGHARAWLSVFHDAAHVATCSVK